MFGYQLSNKLNYNGMEVAARKLALEKKMASVEDIATMTIGGVCDLIVKDYEMVASSDESVLLIPKDNMEEFESMAVFLDR